MLTVFSCIQARYNHSFSSAFAKRNYRLPVRAHVSVFPCFRVSLFLHDNSKRNRARNMKFKYAVVYENNSDKFDIEHCWTKVKVTARL